MLVKTDGLTLANTLGVFNSLSDVDFFEPNFVIHTDSIPNDSQFNQLWGLHNTGANGGVVDADIDAPEAWDVTRGSRDVVVAVIDTGVDYNHPDLAPNIWVNAREIPGNGIDDDGNGYVDDYRGFNFYDHTPDPMDNHFHGTHVAGTIGAVGNNGLGVTGVAQNVSIMPLKFLGSNGSGPISAAIQAINYTTMMKVRNGVNIRVSNNSWGGGGYSEGLDQAIRENAAAGILFVAAAGNSARDTDIYPAYPAAYSIENIISVGATDRTDQPASYSNWGRNSVDLWAPGSAILSTTPNNTYSVLSGTSMATPHVSGTAALVFARNPSMTAVQAKARLMETVDAIVPAVSRPTVTGGRLNAFRAVTGAASTPAPQVTYQLVPNGNGQKLIVRGTDNPDQIAFVPQGYFRIDLVANGEELGEFSTLSLNRIEVYAGGGDDTVEGKGVDVPMTIFGGDGDDRLGGGTAADTIFGGNGDDNIRGRGSDDTLYGDLASSGFGHDVIRGGGGNDDLFGGDGNDLLVGRRGYDDLYGGRGRDMLAGGTHFDQLYGGRGRDELWQENLPSEAKRRYFQDFRPAAVSSIGDNLEVSTNGPNFRVDVAAGWTSAVSLTVGFENGALVTRNFGVVVSELRDWTPTVIEIRGGSGNDRLENRTSLSSILRGGNGNDVLLGNSGVDYLYGNSGNDSLYGRNGSDRLFGEDGDDSIWGGYGHDLLDGGTGNDSLWGEAGNDELWGQLGDDFLKGGDGNDVLHGNEGIDMLYGDLGNDVLRGGDGNDFAWGGAGDDEIHGGNGADNLEGGDGNDRMFGGNGNDVLRGLAGSDYLEGGAGIDWLYGGTGNDRLNARDGSVNDFVFGGLGNDIYELDGAFERKG